MARTQTLMFLAAFLAVPAAEARQAKTPAKPPVNAALKTRDTALHDFNARMSRLDALMGVPTVAPARARSAEAGR
jgi:hypothetical protein